MMAAIEAPMAPVWQAAGLPVSAAAGLYDYLYIDRCPPSLQRPEIKAINTAHPVQPLSFDEPAGVHVPPWLDGARDRPTIYVTLGTEFNSTERFATILAALAEVTDCNVIVTIGLDGDPSELGSQPSHSRRTLRSARLRGRRDQRSRFRSHVAGLDFHLSPLDTRHSQVSESDD